jgi:hypothetical protein
MVDYYYITFAVVLITSVWVAVDAHRNRIPSGKKPYSGNDPYMYLFCCLALWIVAFPFYLFHRSKILKARRMAEGTDRNEEARGEG